MDFASTKGGHEFLYGTMPALARNVKDLTEAVKALANQTQSATATPAVKIPEEEIPEVVGIVIDIIEDYLDSYKVDITNPEKDSDDDADNTAHIYGSDYDDIGGPVEHFLTNLSQTRENALNAVKETVSAFDCLMKSGRAKGELPPMVYADISLDIVSYFTRLGLI